MKKTVVLVNPTSGSGKGGRTWEKLQKSRPDLVSARVICCSALDQARGELTDTLSGNVRRLIVIGGDGTFHNAADQLLASGLADQVAIGLIPAGTGSDYARIAGLSGNPLKALARILTVEPRRVDVLQICDSQGNTRYAVNTFSAGVSGWVGEHMAGDKGNVSAAYLRATLKAFVSYRPVSCRVTIDGEPWFSGPLYLLAITKGSHFGQGMYISPRAVLDNGLAEITAVMPMARWQLPLRLGRLYLGNHLGTSYVHYRRGRSIQLEPGAGCNSFETDGEISAASPVRIDTLPAALSLLA